MLSSTAKIILKTTIPTRAESAAEGSSGLLEHDAPNTEEGVFADAFVIWSKPRDDEGVAGHL